MRRSVRKTAPRVRHGRVQPKNRRTQSPNPLLADAGTLTIERRRAGRGYRHLVRKQDIRRFVDLLPQWDKLREGLRCVVLDDGRQSLLGWHEPGVVALCAWETDIEWPNCDVEFVEEHRETFDKLGIPVERGADKQIAVRFTPGTAKAFLLIHVLLHELGHHHDRMTTRSQRTSARGETYAEAYARRYEDDVLRRYRREFAL